MIETPRTLMRPYEGTEAPLLLPVFSDPTTMSFWPRPPDEEDVTAWVARAAREFRETGMGRMLVVDRLTGETIGDCGIMRAEVDGRPENDLGYIIHHPYWGAGLGTECARACLGYGIQTLGLRRALWGCPQRSTNSGPTSSVCTKSAESSRTSLVSRTAGRYSVSSRAGTTERP